MTNVNAFVINELQKRLALLMEEYVKVQRKIILTYDPSIKYKLELQCEDIENDMRKIEDEINELKLLQPNKQALNNLNDVFPQIDFETTVRLLRDVLDERLRGRQCGALTILLQEADAEVASWCVSRIKRDFFDRFHAKWCELDIQTNTTTIEILKGIGDKLCIVIPTDNIALDEEDYATWLIDMIVKDIIRSSRVVFFRIANIDRLLLSERHSFKEIHKFVRIFWKRLVSKLNKIAREYDDVWFVLCFVSEGRLTPKFFPEHMRCTVDAFDEHKILELPLHNWRREDIEACLKQYRGLSKQAAQLWANYIHERSQQGMPLYVYRKILQLDQDLVNSLPRVTPGANP